MKKFKKIMAVLVAAMMIAVMVTPMMGTKVWAASRTIDAYRNYSAEDTTVTNSVGAETIPAALTRTGYVFKGWNTLQNGSGTSYNPGDACPEGDGTLSLYAQWESTTDSGVLGVDYAKITIANPKKDETYTAYRLFDLASFLDEDVRTKKHDGEESDGNAKEWYSYVISETLSNGTTPNPWWDFIRNWGYTNGLAEYKYAVSDSPNVDTTEHNNAYFFYSNEKVTINGKNDYHIIKANKAKFDNDWDDPETNGTDSTPDPTERTENGNSDGASAGIDYVSHNNKVVQAFAQEALRYVAANPTSFSSLTTTDGVKSMQATAANLESDGTLKLVRQDRVVDSNTQEVTGRDDSMPIGYYLIGTTMGTLAALDTTNTSVTVFEKNDEPALTKKVLKKGSPLFSGNADTTKNKDGEGNITGYADSDYWVRNTDADLQGWVQFRTTITAEQGLKDYKLYDVMEQGLTFNQTEYLPFGTNNTDALKNGYRVVLERDDKTTKATTYYEIPRQYPEFTKGNVTIPAGDNYTFGSSSDLTATKATFIITFNDTVKKTGTDGHYTTDPAYAAQVNFVFQKSGTGTAADDYDVLEVKDGDRIVVYYSAKLNADAAIWGEQEADTTGEHYDDDKTAIKLNDGSTDLPVGQQHSDENDTHRNENYTVLTYGGKAYTQWETASVTTYQFDIVKTRDDSQWSLLAGAKFKMYKVVKQAADPDSDDNDATVSSSWTLGTGNKYWATTAPLSFAGSPAYVYNGDVSTGVNTGASCENNGTTLLSAADAAINVRGLEAGTYLIEEIEAPTGYDKLAHPFVIEINKDANYNAVFEDEDPAIEGSIYRTTIKNNGTLSADLASNPVGAKALIVEDDTNNDGYNYDDTGEAMPNPTGESTSSLVKAGVHIINTTGEELPSTGGMGTTVLYIVGGMMVILAGAYLFFSKRRNAA